MLRPLRPVSILLIVILGVFLCSLPALAQRTPDLEKIRKREIAVIRFEGDSTIPPLELESIIATRTSSWFERTLNGISSGWGTPRQFIDESILADDTMRIFVYYRNRGYFDVRVNDTSFESKESADAWQKVYSRNPRLPENDYPLIEDTVVFRIKEGKPYNVAGFTFEGFEHLPMDLQNNLTEKIGIKLNSQYSRDAIEREAVRVREILSENGYPFLSLPYGYTVVEKDTLRKTVTVSLKFKTGPRVRVGDSRIIYDTAYSKTGHVREQVIRKQLSLEPTKWYKNSDKLVSERDLNKLGTFQSVKIELDSSSFAKLTDSAKDGMALPVNIYLRMRQSWEITPYPYFGESAFNQFILGVGLSYSNRNIFNGAENLRLQASYQILPWLTVERRWNISGDLVLPFLSIMNSPLIGSLGFSYAKVEGRYFEQISTASAGYNFELSNDPSLRITLSPKGALQVVQREYLDSALRPRDSSFQLQPQLNTIASFDLIFNTTDDPLFPSRGWYVSWSPQYAVPVAAAIAGLFGSTKQLPSASYLKNTLQFKTYFDLGSTTGRSVLAFRISGGLVALTNPNDPNKDILFENRYYGGGTNSLRGWAARTLLVSNNTSPGWPSLGGYKAFETNLEWRYAIFHYPAEITAIQQFLSALRIAFFCDAGNVWDKDVPVSTKNFAIALGTGIRYNTLFGAIRFDWGLKFYDPYPDPYQPGTLGVNKSRENVLAIPPNTTTGVWLFNRKNYTLGDVLHFEFALGQAF
ncbi:MAG: outer membrane protein assembly factor [Candidatus Kapaibacterium sp.]